MILGAVIIGMAIGMMSMAMAIALGANVLSAIWIYCAVGTGTAAAVCAVRALACKNAATHKPDSDTTQPNLLR